MKKMTAFLFVIIMSISIFPSVLSIDANETESIDDTNDGNQTTNDEIGGDTISDEYISELEEEAIDEETEKEIGLISESGVGAKIRVLQLRRAVLKSVLAASVLTEFLSEKGEDVSEIEAISAELDILKEEADGLDSTSSGTVDDFINIKRDLRDLNRQFKEISTQFISDDDRPKIHEAIQTAFEESAELDSIKEEIKNAHTELNAWRVEKMLGRMGVQNDKIIEKIKNREITEKEIKVALIARFKQLSDEQKKTARQKISDALKNRQTVTANIVERVKKNHISVRKKRLEERIDKIPIAQKANAVKRINTEIKKLGGAERRITAQVNALKKEKAIIKNQIVENKEKAATIRNRAVRTAINNKIARTNTTTSGEGSE